MVRPLLKRFEENGGGQFVFIGSRPALNPNEGRHEVAYALSKKLVDYLADLINAHGKDKNITATVVVPSIIDTPKNREILSDKDFSSWVSLNAIADTIDFILSDSGKQIREGKIKLYNNA
jgi:NAD(P)-dependent dehydrogenase (short-subunit alcohol dehydrogenase family)